MAIVPCRSRFPVFGSLIVAYEMFPERFPVFAPASEIVPVGAIVELEPNTVATKFVVDPEFTGFGEAWRLIVGVGYLTRTVTEVEVAG